MVVDDSVEGGVEVSAGLSLGRIVVAGWRVATRSGLSPTTQKITASGGKHLFSTA